MKENYLIGVDLGTSAVKSTLFNLDGEAVADAFRPMEIHQPKPGHAEQKPDDFVVAVGDTIRKIIEKSAIAPSSVAAVAFDGQMAGAMGIDRHWNPITPWYPSALDTRYQPYAVQMSERAGDRLIELNGAMPFAAPRMLWWKELFHDVYKKIDKVVILPNFVAGALAGLRGEQAFMDPSFLTWFGLGNTAERCWSSELIDKFDINEELLPRIVPATTIIGHISVEVASQCGLLSGTPLVAGTGDQVAGALGAGIVQEGQLLDVAGTFSGLIACIKSYLPDTRFNMLQPLAGPLSESHWYSMMYIGGGGLTHQWFLDEFGIGVMSGHEDSLSVAKGLGDLAAAVPPGSEGLLFIPHLAGRSCPSDPLVRGAWIGFTWTHRRQHFYRALLESIAFDFAQTLEILLSYRPDQQLEDVRVVGGGARNALWNQIKSDVLGLHYKRLCRDDTATLGCAIIAGHAVGIFPDMAEMAIRFAKTTDNIEPNRSQHRLYEKYIKAYGKIFDQLHDAFNTIATLSGG